MRIALTTLGCKINQYESEVIRRELLSRGNTIVPFDADADFYIINTCSVTARSDYQCRQAIRSAVKRGQNAKVIVTGCYASTRPEELKSIQGVTHVVPNNEKVSIPLSIMSENPASAISDLSCKKKMDEAGGRTRAFLKIQDGCDNRCSYCIVPLARGASRSVAQAAVVTEFDRMVRDGSPEVVLSGVHIGTYGMDVSPKSSLTALLEHLMQRRNRTRLRLSSIEPQEITPGIIDLLGNGLCRHLHIPLQSGDNSVLSAMRRRYTAESYLELISGISAKVPGIALGADIMVGFPGEGDREFENTCRLVQQSPLTHLHVFSYSQRPGTPAAEMKNQVPEPVKKERSEALRMLGRRKNLEFRQKQAGLELKAIVENKKDPLTGMLTGMTDNYIRLLFDGSETALIGQEITIKVEKIDERDNYGLIL